jgi:hypothetical protein
MKHTSILWAGVLVAAGAMGASRAVAGLIPTKASQLSHSAFYSAPPSGCDASPGQLNANVSPQPVVGEVFVATSFSWHATGVPANSFMSVDLYMSSSGGGGTHVATSGAIANSAGHAVGSLDLQPGVVALWPAAGLTSLCLKVWEGSGTLQSGTGSVVGFIAKDK